MNIYISPHPDDAIISCGGRILKEKEKNQVVINVFCKNYDGLTKWDQLSENLEKPMENRIKEDKQILSSLGVSVFYLDFYDNAVYSDILKNKRDKEEVKEIEKRLIEIISSFSNNIKLFFPFGIDHKDHKLIAGMGVRLQKEEDVSFYQDLPYGFFKQTDLNKKKYLITDVIEEKMDLIFEYQSQINGLISLTKIKSKDDFKEKFKELHLGKDLEFYENLILI